jgi:signal transduction histidine kinase
VSALSRALQALGIAGFVGGLIVLVLALSTDVHADDAPAMWGPLIGWAFIGAGLYAWQRQPENRTGSLMTAVGFSWLVATLTVSSQPEVFIFGFAAYALPYAFVIHLLAGFPSGRLTTRLERLVVALGYVVTTLLVWAMIPVFDTAAHGWVVENPLLVERNDALHGTLNAIQGVLGIAGVITLGVILFRRFRASTGSQRQALALVGVAAGFLLASIVLVLVSDLAALDGNVEAATDAVGRMALLAVPFAFLLALLRSRYSRAMAVSQLVSRAAERRVGLRDALADALGDPALRLAYWIPDRDHFVDAGGRPVVLPPHAVRVEQVGAIVSEAEPELVESVAAAAALAMENERLEAELHARIEELRDSRARIVEAADDERRRLERDLHDGAQQRLVALALTLRLARSRTDGEAAELLDGASAELAQATAELRELARGIHPAVLTDRGLAPAVDALAARATIPVEVAGVPQDRLPAGVEAAAYFLVAEALTNVSRYAGAGHAEVRMERHNGTLVVEVRDDGVGGADPAAGTGLRGLADRVAALDGRLEISSPEGEGTIVRAWVPCAS